MQASPVTTTDLAADVVARMRELGICGLPRNYEIVYDVIAGNNEALERDFAALGLRPSQDALDELGRRHLGRDQHDEAVNVAHKGIVAKVDEIMALIHREQATLEKYGVVLTQTNEGLNGRQTVSLDLMRKIAQIMALATSSTIEKGREIVTTIADKSTELEEVKAKLDEYRRLADTDALTQLANRRAFDRRMAAIYKDPRAALFHGLIVLDIDLFKRINDCYGHPAGDKVLQQLASVLDAATGAGMLLARTGGEEFALIVEGLSKQTVNQFAEDLRAMVERTEFRPKTPAGDSETISISLGLCMASEARSPEELYARADTALQASKREGRNRVAAWPLPPALKRKDWFLYRTD